MNLILPFKDNSPQLPTGEDFLREYDPDLRKKLGAYYTPQPVVRFIVRSVDYILQKEFNLPSGLADTTKLENGTHKVQILDPAVGTGTFLSAVIRNIYLHLKEKDQLGRWTSYVHHDLLPRIHGFEIMMAPYTIAHLKLSMAFRATGFKHFNRRLGIYLTNSLEEADQIGDLFTGFGFADTIAEESKEAAVIKNDTPIMVVIGNPPYSVSSSNKGEWIIDLIKDYKKDLNERKINLDDDYIKFIRYAEHYIEKNKSGIVAMITNNSFIDGITHRQMRKHLLETFDEIYILDLHGNSNIKETAPDGTKDENVFDIMQGVAISIMVKKSKNNIKHAEVNFAEIYGERSHKFDLLVENKLDEILWSKVNYSSPYYFFINKDEAIQEQYDCFIELKKLFNVFSSGIKTERDFLCVHFRKEEIKKVVFDFRQLPKEELKIKYKLKKDSRDWKLNNAIQDLIENDSSNMFQKFLYRPFDFRYTYYTGTTRGFIGTPGKKTASHFIGKDNLGIIYKRSRLIGTKDFKHLFVANSFVDINLLADQSYLFPLYLYEQDAQNFNKKFSERESNLNTEIVEKIEKITGKTEPEDILDYIYAVLHSPSYREKYKEFLKIDFPRVPYPKDKETFKKLVKLGTELRLIHLLESPKVNELITSFPKMGNDEVEKIKYKEGKVWINDEQYFGNVPQTAWEFYIGGYQPAQKWLKDRKGRILTNEEIEHYQKIIKALTETDRLMKEIDKIDF